MSLIILFIAENHFDKTPCHLLFNKNKSSADCINDNLHSSSSGSGVVAQLTWRFDSSLCVCLGVLEQDILTAPRAA